MGDVLEGEDTKSSSYEKIPKKSICLSPSLTRGRKPNKNRKKKDPRSRNSGSIAYSDGIASIVS
jgi:hypothetical protein